MASSHDHKPGTFGRGYEPPPIPSFEPDEDDPETMEAIERDGNAIGFGIGFFKDLRDL